jgi:hypothetical protein
VLGMSNPESRQPVTGMTTRLYEDPEPVVAVPELSAQQEHDRLVADLAAVIDPYQVLLEGQGRKAHAEHRTVWKRNQDGTKRLVHDNRFMEHGRFYQVQTGLTYGWLQREPALDQVIVTIGAGEEDAEGLRLAWDVNETRRIKLTLGNPKFVEKYFDDPALASFLDRMGELRATDAMEATGLSPERFPKPTAIELTDYRHTPHVNIFQYPRQTLVIPAAVTPEQTVGIAAEMMRLIPYDRLSAKK